MACIMGRVAGVELQFADDAEVFGMATRAAIVVNEVDFNRLTMRATLERCLPGARVIESRATESGSRQAPAAHAIWSPGGDAPNGRLAGRLPNGRRHRVFAELAAYRPELVIAENFGVRTCQAIFYRRFHPRTRLILWVTRRPAVPSWALRLVLRQADGILLDGDAAAQAILDHPGLLPPLFAFSGLNRDALAPFLLCPLSRPEPQAHRLVFAGDLAPQAGVADFLLCAAAWAERNPHRTIDLWWIGDGDLRGALAAQPLPGNLSQRFLGALPDAEMASAFSECGALVVPTVSGDARHPVPQALAAGLPVLGSTRDRAVRERIRDGRTGWLFDLKTPDALYEALSRMMDAPCSALDRMRAAARSEIEALAETGMAERMRYAVEALVGTAEMLRDPARVAS